MEKLKKTLTFLRINWRTLAGFEILYKALSMAVFTPLFWGMFQQVMEITGYRYLTFENIVPFAANPVTALALLALLACMACYTMVDIGAVIFLLDQSAQGKRAGLLAAVDFALRNAGRVFCRENILVAFPVLFLIPFLNLGVASSYISSISIPEFILDFIMGNGQLLFLFTAAVIGLEILLLRWLYVFHYFTLEGCSFSEARKKSAALSRKHKCKDLAALLGIQLVFALLYFMFLFAGVLLAVLLGGLISKWELFGIVSSSVVWVFLAASLLVASALGTPISYACISILFYGHKSEKQEGAIHQKARDFPESKRRRRIIHGAEFALFALSVGCCSFYLYCISNHKVSINVENLRTMEVTAHRGASRERPENTMAAFVRAKELGAGWIELDVQQSRDGQVFVMHDTNLKRVAGIDKNTWELDYGEIRGMDVGSFFGASFAGEHAPLLSEAIAFAKENGIKLNIELKPTGHEQDFEKNVAGIIAAEGFREGCVITSQSYGVLERMKSCDSRIPTAYVMSIAYGDISLLTAADHFSIEATSVTEKLVSDVHNAGKELYAWTVNTEENIRRMAALNVDNIITDDVSLAKECIFLSKTSNAVEEYAKWLAR